MWEYVCWCVPENHAVFRILVIFVPERQFGGRQVCKSPLCGLDLPWFPFLPLWILVVVIFSSCCCCFLKGGGCYWWLCAPDWRQWKSSGVDLSQGMHSKDLFLDSGQMFAWCLRCLATTCWNWSFAPTTRESQSTMSSLSSDRWINLHRFYLQDTRGCCCILFSGHHSEELVHIFSNLCKYNEHEHAVIANTHWCFTDHHHY